MTDIREMGDVLEEGIEKVRDRVDEARERIEKMGDKVKYRSEEAWKDAAEFVRKHPVQSLGVAALIGAAVGALLAGGRRD